MENEIRLLKNNDKREWSDLEWIREFHAFLQGEIPESISLSDDYRVKLTPEQSSAIIWYLQEHFPVFPDNIDMCEDCKRMYNSHSEGCYYEIEGKHFCGECQDNSDVTYCDECMDEVWKKDALTDDGMYYCDDCKIKKQD